MMTPPVLRLQPTSGPKRFPLRRVAGVVAEGRWFVALSLATLALVEVPYLLAHAQALRGHAFVGMIWEPQDFAQYGAAMREGAASSSWLVHDHLTAEPHDPVLMYPLYVALGKLAALAGADVQIAFHLAGIAARAALLASIALFCGELLPTVGQRRLAFILIAFSSGLAAVLAPAHRLMGIDFRVSLEGFNVVAAPATASRLFSSYLPEASTAVVWFTPPHLILGLALLLLAARSYLRSWTACGFAHAALAGVAVLGLGLVNPFSLVPLCSVVGVHLAVMWARQGSLPRGAILGGAAILAAALPSLGHSLLVFDDDPFWGIVYGAQNVMPSPPLPDFLLALGAIVALAALGLPAFARPSPGRWLVVIWIALGFTLAYAPVGYQRRFAFGLQPMLAVIAAIGLERVWRWARGWRGEAPLGSRRRRDLIRPVGGLALGYALFGSTATFYAYVLFAATTGASPAGSRPPGDRAVFQPASLQRAAAWLAVAMEPDDVILAHTLTGNFLGGTVPGRVFVGHWVATLHFRDKVEQMQEFYREATDDVRLDFLATNRVRYVVYGPHERALGASSPPAGPRLRLVYVNDEVSIYEWQADDGLARSDR